MKDIKIEFCWSDYIDYCIIANKKPSHYQTLKDFKEFVNYINSFK